MRSSRPSPMSSSSRSGICPRRCKQARRISQDLPEIRAGAADRTRWPAGPAMGPAAQEPQSSGWCGKRPCMRDGTGDRREILWPSMWAGKARTTQRSRVLVLCAVRGSEVKLWVDQRRSSTANLANLQASVNETNQHGASTCGARNRALYPSRHVFAADRRELLTYLLT